MFRYVHPVHAVGDPQAVEFRTNSLDVDVTGVVVVNFCGPQIDTVDTKSTRRDIIIQQIRPKFHSKEMKHAGFKQPL